MKKTFAFRIAASAFAAALCAGCGSSVAETEAEERQSALYRNAEADYKAGRLDAAVEGFEKTVRKIPEAASAHFQLAVLLQDHKKDYIGAIAHYREYIAMRPGADKFAVAQGRAALCRSLLANELAPSAGVSPEKDKKAAAELRKALAEAEKLKKENLSLARKIVSLGETNKRLSKELETALSAGTGTGSGPSAKRGAEPAPKPPDEMELIAGDAKEDNPLAEARSVLEAAGMEDSPEAAGGLAEAKAVLAEAGEEDAKAPPLPPRAKGPAEKPRGSLLPSLGGGADGKSAKTPQRPAVYTVEPGDTLMSISRKFYGTDAEWKRIRELNKAAVSTDAEIRAGMKLKLP